MNKNSLKSSFEEKVLEGLEECGFNVEFSSSHRMKIGIAVSGGADSVSLLLALNSLSLKYDFSVFVININHNI